LAWVPFPLPWMPMMMNLRTGVYDRVRPTAGGAGVT
jgi:hypothetical protein